MSRAKESDGPIIAPNPRELLAYLGEVAQYVYDTYSKFPATLPTIFMRACVQAHHLDTEFYETHFQKGAYLETHAQHLARWHPPAGKEG